MKNFLLFKHLANSQREYIFIFLTATIFLFTTYTKSFSEENVFTINNVQVEGDINLNFSRDKFLNMAFLDSFETLMTKILLTRDLKKVENVKLEKIKKLMSGFQVLEESYSKDEYKANFKIIYNDAKVKKFLSEKNISFSQPDKISVIFYPVLFINDEIQSFNENFFYKNWTQVVIKNEIINFLLPIEDLDDVSRIMKMKDRIEELNIDTFVNKYDVKNYVFALMDYKNKKLNIHLKTNFNSNVNSKNIFYDLKDMKNQLELNLILKDLKLNISDLWKEENLINLLMPLSIKLKFEHKNLQDLDELRNILKKINIIDNYALEEFDVNNSFFKIYYYGDPKKLKSQLLKLGYRLKNNQGFWQLYLNE
ncbi:MAG: hypothetical protein EVA76_03595 [Candidatus Pelagibacterales bacterium]|nr:MAG: hypothetical protein EVA76_03595 [Pelagibacterales bacterium]